MYLISILTVMIVIALLVSFGQTSIAVFIDLPSVLLLVILLVPILISAGVWKDFNNAFRIVMERKSEATIAQINRSIAAVELAGKTLLFGSSFIAACSMMIILATLSSPEQLGPNLAVALLSFLYGLLGYLLLLPLKTRLVTKKIELMQ